MEKQAELFGQSHYTPRQDQPLVMKLRCRQLIETTREIMDYEKAQQDHVKQIGYLHNKYDYLVLLAQTRRRDEQATKK